MSFFLSISTFDFFRILLGTIFCFFIFKSLSRVLLNESHFKIFKIILFSSLILNMVMIIYETMVISLNFFVFNLIYLISTPFLFIALINYYFNKDIFRKRKSRFWRNTALSVSLLYIIKYISLMIYIENYSIDVSIITKLYFVIQTLSIMTGIYVNENRKVFINN